MVDIECDLLLYRWVTESYIWRILCMTISKENACTWLSFKIWLIKIGHSNYITTILTDSKSFKSKHSGILHSFTLFVMSVISLCTLISGMFFYHLPRHFIWMAWMIKWLVYDIRKCKGFLPLVVASKDRLCSQCCSIK